MCDRIDLAILWLSLKLTNFITLGKKNITFYTKLSNGNIAPYNPFIYNCIYGQNISSFISIGYF